MGRLAALTGVSPRMLRYYESRGLLSATRSSSGQRLFDRGTVTTVRHIRWLLSAGLPTRVIRELLDCIEDPDRIEPCAVPVLLEHVHAYEQQIAELTTTRQALQGLIEASGTSVASQAISQEVHNPAARRDRP